MPAGEHILVHRGAIYRVAIDSGGADPPAVILPFDRLFEIRAAAAIRLWRMLHDADPGPDPAPLTGQRRQRLMLALRALDGKAAGAAYREIADVLLRTVIKGRAWKSHDLRGQIIRVTKLGIKLMQGQYRELLLHPYRRPPRRLKP